MMFVLGSIIGLLLGAMGSYAYWTRTKKVPLTQNSVLLSQNTTTQSPWSVSLSDTISVWDKQSIIFEIQSSQCTFVFVEDLSLLCEDSKRLDVECRITIQPKRQIAVLERLLSETEKDNLNNAQWIQQKIESEVLHSIGIFRINTQEFWLQNIQVLEEHWNARLQPLLSDWDVNIQVTQCTATDHSFYNINNPDEHKHLLNNQHSQMDFQSVKQQLREHEHNLKNLAVQKALWEQKQQEWQKHQQSMADFQQQTKMEIQQMARNVQQDLATLKTAIRESFFQLAEKYPAEVLEEHFNNQSKHRITIKRNALESQVEQQQISTLQQLADLIQDSPNEDNTRS